MSRNKMNQLGSQLKTMYLTENPVNLSEGDMGYKYFICFHNTHKVVNRFKNIPDTIEALEDIIENGARQGAHVFY